MATSDTVLAHGGNNRVSGVEKRSAQTLPRDPPLIAGGSGRWIGIIPRAAGFRCSSLQAVTSERNRSL